MFWFRSRAERSGSPDCGAGDRAQELHLHLMPPPLPEVVEDNGEEVWALWEASVAAMDEHVQSLAAEAAAASRQGTLAGDSVPG